MDPPHAAKVPPLDGRWCVLPYRMTVLPFSTRIDAVLPVVGLLRSTCTRLAVPSPLLTSVYVHPGTSTTWSSRFTPMRLCFTITQPPAVLFTTGSEPSGYAGMFQ